jgi:uncharacterized membrane protein
MIMQIILFFCLFPVLVILYFIMRNEAKPKKNIILGVTLPYDARENAAVLRIVKGYMRRLNLYAVGLTLLMAPVFLIEHDSVAFTYFITWMLLTIIFPHAVFAGSNKKLKSLKAENNWYSEASGLAMVDMKVAAMPKQSLKIVWFIPPMVISLIPVLHTVLTLRGTEEFWWMILIYGIYALLVAAYYFMYRIIYHQRAEVIDENTSLSVALTQIRRYNWGKCWILTAWLTCIFNLAFWLFEDTGPAPIIITLLYSLILLAVIMRVEFKTRRLQQKLTEGSGRTAYTDDDDKWLFGMFYYNPNDNHLMINNRVGIGTTINLAKSSGKALAAFSVIILLGMPLIGIWMMKEEFTPVRLEASDTQIVAYHTKEVYAINMDDIESAEFIYSLPRGTRTAGSALDTVLKGYFRFDGIGSCRLCLNPQVTPFIVIKTAEGTYVFGSSDSGETYAVFDLIKSHALALVH